MTSTGTMTEKVIETDNTAIIEIAAADIYSTDDEEEEEDWSNLCTICGPTSSTSHITTDRLCRHCSIWNDLTHVTKCLDSKYPLLNPADFGTRIAQKYVSTEGLNAMDFRPLDQVISSTDCLLCAQLGQTFRFYQNSERDTQIAIWRPFEVDIPYYPEFRDDTSQDDQFHSTYTQETSEGQADLRIVSAKPSAESSLDNENEDQDQDDSEHDQSLSISYILPVCISTSSAVTTSPTYNTFALELEFHYAQYGFDLKSINRWNRSKIKLDVIHEWLDICQKYHGAYCNDVFLTRKLPPSFRLIDTYDWSITLAPENSDYLAFSYMWAAATPEEGDRKPFLLKLENIAALDQKNALRNDEVPEVISDAIQFSADLGYRYLWVDQLCIIQDEETSKREQINSMDIIFHKATMTIVALTKGIGLPGVSCRPREVDLEDKHWNLDFDISSRTFSVSPTKVRYAIRKSPWNKRGWTYQERILSRRRIYIDKNHFYLDCTHHTHESDHCFPRVDPRYEECEGTALPPSYGFGHDPSFRNIPVRHDDAGREGALTKYLRAVDEYTNRELTLDDDSLNAFMGVANAFAASEETEPLFGIPEKYFLPSILWRHSRARRPRVFVHEPQIPSWAWSAWEGHVENDMYCWSYERVSDPKMEKHPRSHHCVVSCADSLVGSLVTFHFADATGKIRKIPSHRSHIEPPDDEAPCLGVYPETIRKCEEMVPAKTEGTDAPSWKDYVHNPWTAARYAELLDEIALAEGFPNCLLFNTTVASLYIEITPQGKPPQALKEIKLLTDSGIMIGQVFEKRLEHAEAMFQSGKKYKIAVICASFPMNINVEPNRDDPFDLVVMVLDSESQVCKRLALGAVNHEAWTEVQPKWETVILG